jgi:hypothetical protein
MNDEVLNEGYLIKEGKNWKSWKTRYFILKRNGELSYFTDINEKLKGTINVKGSQFCSTWV